MVHVIDYAHFSTPPSQAEVNAWRMQARRSGAVDAESAGWGSTSSPRPMECGSRPRRRTRATREWPSTRAARAALDHLTTSSSRFVDLGNLRYVTRSGKNRTVHTWRFLAVELDRKVPHMVLDARSNNRLFGATHPPAAFDKGQVLSLKDDFNEHFTLYCPQQ